MKKFFSSVGRTILGFLYYIGGASILCAQAFVWMFIPGLKRKQILDHMNMIGVTSLPIVSLISMFTGMVLVFQTAYQMLKISSEIYIASIVALSIVRELGPVLTALVVAGKAGAAISAEIGTMKVTEQIDALETLATNPVRFLVTPRFIAFIVMLPILTLYADFIGIMGGYIVGVGNIGVGSNIYIKMTFNPLLFKDLFSGLLKSVIFGAIICIISCFEGFNTEGGAEGVGKATNRSVVNSFVMIIAADCLFTALFYFVW